MFLLKNVNANFEIIEWDNVAVSATQNCILIVYRQTFLIIRPMKKQLALKFYSDLEQNNSTILKSISCSGKYENHICVAALDELTPEVFRHIKQSYILL